MCDTSVKIVITTPILPGSWCRPTNSVYIASREVSRCEMRKPQRRCLRGCLCVKNRGCLGAERMYFPSDVVSAVGLRLVQYDARCARVPPTAIEPVKRPCVAPPAETLNKAMEACSVPFCAAAFLRLPISALRPGSSTPCQRAWRPTQPTRVNPVK